MDVPLERWRATVDRAKPLRARNVDARWWYAAAASVVLDAWLDPAVACRWLFARAARPLRAATIEARAGGAVRLVTRDGELVTGRIDAIVRSTHLRFTLDEAPLRTTVGVDLTPSAGGTVVHVRHTGIAPYRADGLDAHWSGMLYGLGETLDCDSHELFPTKEWR